MDNIEEINKEFTLRTPGCIQLQTTGDSCLPVNQVIKVMPLTWTMQLDVVVGKGVISRHTLPEFVKQMQMGVTVV